MKALRDLVFGHLTGILPEVLILAKSDWAAAQLADEIVVWKSGFCMVPVPIKKENRWADHLPLGSYESEFYWVRWEELQRIREVSQ